MSVLFGCAAADNKRQCFIICIVVFINGILLKNDNDDDDEVEDEVKELGCYSDDILHRFFPIKSIMSGIN